jgi:hypothetical protein
VTEAAYKKGDPSHVYRLVEIKGQGVWAPYSVRLFYVVGFKSGDVKAGDVIGYAQDLTTRYPADEKHSKPITNHVQMEVRRNGTLVDPRSIFRACF